MNAPIRTKPSLADQALRLMADGRERTAGDIAARLKITEDTVRLVMTHLVKAKAVKSDRIFMGKQATRTWRKA
jgi:predicted ArsR family transcriptional regulator